MCSIGDEALLRRIGLSQSIQGAIDRVHQGMNLAGQAPRRDAGARVGGTHKGNLVGRQGEVAQAPAAGQPNQRDGAEAERQQYGKILVGLLEQDRALPVGSSLVPRKGPQRLGLTTSPAVHEPGQTQI